MIREHITPHSTEWAHDRSNTVGASEIGACARQIWFKKHLGDRDDGRWGFRVRGHTVEEWVMARLRVAGVPIVEMQRTLSSGFLSATVDALLGNTCVEVKSFDPRKHEPVEPRHISQVKVQIGLWREVGKREIEGGVLVYVNASDYQDIREVAVPLDEGAYRAAHQRAERIMTAQSAEDLPREGRIAGGKECTLCSFQVECLGRAIADQGNVSEEQRERIASLRADAKAAEKDIRVLEKQVATAREAARDILRAADVRRVPGLVSVRRTSRNGLDEKAMEADGIDLSKYRKTGTETETVAWT